MARLRKAQQFYLLEVYLNGTRVENGTSQYEIGKGYPITQGSVNGHELLGCVEFWSE